MDEKLVFIRLIGEETDEYYRYEFLFSTNVRNFTIEEDNMPCCLCQTIRPVTTVLSHIVKMKIKLDLIQNNCCFSFKHTKLGIVALGWQNLDDEEEYPEDGRLFFMFGETIDDVERKLAIKNVLMLN